MFLKLWEQRSSLPEVKSIEDYCFILVKNASLNYLEKENRRTTVSTETLPEPEAQSDSPEESMISEELFAIYVKALDRLPERCREVFIRIREAKLCTGSRRTGYQHQDRRRSTPEGNHPAERSNIDGE